MKWESCRAAKGIETKRETRNEKRFWTQTEMPCFDSAQMKAANSMGSRHSTKFRFDFPLSL